MRLYPQLLHRDARALADALSGLSLSELVDRGSISHDRAIFGATGGQRISDDDLRDLQRRVRAVGTSVGFLYDDPDETPPIERGHGANLDIALTRFLISEAALTAHEASRPGVWAFFACVLAPELVRWRFPGGDAGTRSERFTGSRLRNLFGRLWWRGFLLYDADAGDPFWIVEALGEDELVQITERPNAAGYGPLARELARQLVDVWHPEVGVNRSELLRAAMKRLLRWMTITRFEALSASEVREVVAELYVQAIKGLTSTHARSKGLSSVSYFG